MEEKRITGRTDGQRLSALRNLARLRGWQGALLWLPTVAAVAVLYLHQTSPPPAICLANYERITAGMSEREVKRIIGARPGYYGGCSYCFNGGRFSLGESARQEWTPAQSWTVWGDAYGILGIGYDAEGRVTCKHLDYYPSVEPARPDLWPWWRRLIERSVPKDQPAFWCSSL